MNLYECLLFRFSVYDVAVLVLISFLRYVKLVFEIRVCIIDRFFGLKGLRAFGYMGGVIDFYILVIFLVR